MKNKICIFYLFLFQGVFLFSQSPEIIWQHSYGGSQWDQANAIKQTVDSGFIVAGYTRSDDVDVLFNHGVYDYWLLKLNSEGSIEWQKSYGGIFSDYAYDVLVTSDNGYAIAGASVSNDGDVSGNHGNYDYWVVKTDELGNIEWQKSYGGTLSDLAHSIAASSDGGYIVVGESSSNDGDVSVNHGESDYWVIKLDNLGEIEWQKSFGSAVTEDAKSVIQTSDGGYCIAGHVYPGDFGSSDYWIIKLDSEGNLIWEKTFGGSGSDLAYSIINSQDGKFAYAAGETFSSDVAGFLGTKDVWITKVDTAGNDIWKKCFGGSSSDQSQSIIQTTDGNYIVAGYSGSTNGDLTETKGDGDYWIFKMDSLGNILWQKSIGGTDGDVAYDIVETSDLNYVVAGYSRSSDFDLTENYGDFDYWIVKLGICNTHYYADEDGDGFGDLFIDSVACNLPIGFVLDSTDCNDTNNLIHPFAEDICNSIDDNCNGEIDEDALFILQYVDADGDGFGDILNDSTSCFEITGYLIDNTDCNDSNALINPSAIEICNLLDDNCNALIDEGLILYTFYADADGDNYGDADVTFISCFEDVPGYISDSTDCDDTNNLIYPGAEELCNYLDDDCDGIVDDNLTYIHSYQDADGDDYGNIEIDSLTCTIPDGFVEDDSDCDDTNPAIYPGAEETLNDIDDNCNELIDEGVGINSLQNVNAISIYPNPAKDKIIFSINSQFNLNSQTLISISDLSGKIISQKVIKSNETEIIVTGYPDGIYFVKVMVDGNQFMQKIIVE